MGTSVDLVIVNESNEVVVSSRRIAGNFGKRHVETLDSIREILAVENSTSKLFRESTYENRGKQYPEFLMNRDGFTLLAMGFNGKDALQWKIKYIQAFNEMEKQLSTPKELTRMQILELAMESERKVIALEAITQQQQQVITEAKPKVAMYDALIDAKALYPINEVAKLIDIPGMGSINLYNFLRERGHINHDNSPYQVWVNAGYFKVKVQPSFTLKNGRKVNTSTSSTLVTFKGLGFIIKALDKAGYKR